MITKDKIDYFIEKIPPVPIALRETLANLNVGDITKAAQSAEKDLALQAYLKNIVNKPIYGFRNEVKNIAQIFTILGVGGSQKTVYNYMTTLLSPSKWKLFKLNSSSFHSLQDDLSVNWRKILLHLKINDKEIESAISLLPASIIVSEALFCEKISDVNLLRSSKSIDYNTILLRLCKTDLFDICEMISKKWDMSIKIAEIVQASSGIKPSKDELTNTLGKWMHLLLFYELSKPLYIEAGLNDFIEFQIDYVSEIYDDFMKVMDVQ